MTLEPNERAMPFSRIKISVFTALIGVIIMIIVTFITSIALSRLDMYERYYTVIEYILKLIPGFSSAKILSKKLSEKLLLPIIIQTVVLVIIFGVISLIFSGRIEPSSFAWNVIIILLSEILGLFRTSKEKKKFHKF